MENKEALIREYLRNSKRQIGQLALGLVLGSLVFVIPMIIIVTNGWWQPFDGDVSVGMRWFVVACVGMALVYIAIIIDKLTRKF